MKLKKSKKKKTRRGKKKIQRLKIGSYNSLSLSLSHCPETEFQRKQLTRLQSKQNRPVISHERKVGRSTSVANVIIRLGPRAGIPNEAIHGPKVAHSRINNVCMLRDDLNVRPFLARVAVSCGGGSTRGGEMHRHRSIESVSLRDRDVETVSRWRLFAKWRTHRHQHVDHRQPSSRMHVHARRVDGPPRSTRGHSRAGMTWRHARRGFSFSFCPKVAIFSHNQFLKYIYNQFVNII